METKEWLESLNPGDRVALNSRWGDPILRNVERVTKTQIVLDNGGRFRKDSGYVVGATRYTRANIEQVTEEIIKQIKYSDMQYKISLVKLKELSLDKIERILAIVNEAENG